MIKYSYCKYANADQASEPPTEPMGTTTSLWTGLVRYCGGVPIWVLPILNLRVLTLNYSG